MQVITLANQKGGVCKSTTAHALAAGLTRRGKIVLLVDLDPQCNLSFITGASTDGATVLDVMTGKARAVDVVQGDVIPASTHLSAIEMDLPKAGREYRLRDALEPIKGKYDYIVIDTPPSLGILTVNAMVASDAVVVPAFADIFSMQGIGQLAETVSAIRTHSNAGLKIRGILLTKHNTRSILNRDMAESIQSAAHQLGTFVYRAFIRESVAVKEAQALRTDIFTYSPKSTAAQDYDAFVKEFIKRGKGQ